MSHLNYSGNLICEKEINPLIRGMMTSAYNKAIQTLFDTFYASCIADCIRAKENLLNGLNITDKAQKTLEEIMKLTIE
jgi:hypothetical protein